MRPVMPLVAVRLNLIIVMLLLGACSPTQRQKTIHAALITVNATRDGFIVWDAQHQLRLVDQAKTPEEGSALLDSYRKDRERVVTGFEAAYRAISVAAVLTDDARQASSVLSTAIALKQAIDAFMEARK